MEGGECQRELQLLPRSSSTHHLPLWTPSNSSKRIPDSPDNIDLSLNLSISISPLPQQLSSNEEANKINTIGMQALKWHAAEQTRLASMEKAYAEQVREMTRKEMELSEKEFARARLVWERAREEVEKVERMKEIATRRINSTCTEITCQSCRQRFRP